MLKCYFINCNKIKIYAHEAEDAEGSLSKIAFGFSVIIAFISLDHVYTLFSNLCFNTSSMIFPLLNTQDSIDIFHVV